MIAPERKKEEHLQREDHGGIQCLAHQGLSRNAIAIELDRSALSPFQANCGVVHRSVKATRAAHPATPQSTERRFTEPTEIALGSTISAQYGVFINQVADKIRTKQWAFDACVGYARLHKLFPEDEMVCTHTLYNELWTGTLSVSVTEVADALKRKQSKEKQTRKSKKFTPEYGKRLYLHRQRQ